MRAFQPLYIYRKPVIRDLGCREYGFRLLQKRRDVRVPRTDVGYEKSFNSGFLGGPGGVLHGAVLTVGGFFLQGSIERAFVDEDVRASRRVHKMLVREAVAAVDYLAAGPFPCDILEF